ncbi:hypothetical protein [Chitinivorax sp. B]|uniref:hypothetical protein n=1 Tax=Chitinivorax sp. B TaxID=2502235 RepID=UPI0010F56C72|nr:hypothetical protein [Chitinivorax sp. B]
MQKAISILWPSFLVAGVMTVLFFTFLDPADLVIFGTSLAEYRIATYSLGFFVFWMFAMGDSWLTLFFQRNPNDVNRFCTLDSHHPNQAHH